MAKKRSLTDDAATLKEKIRTSAQESVNPGGQHKIRSLRKRLKRAQRKLRITRQRAEGPKNKKSGTET
ncbi:MAG: hypothetical protein AB7P17_04535 [Nitrospirales bacterium]|nr:hypothetical protein [Nitrospirales bacterium]